jgi:hypothetical protein
LPDFIFFPQFLLFSCLVYSQIFLILLVGDRQFGYITKLEKKKEHQWDGMIYFIFFPISFLVLHHWQASQEGFSIKCQHNT